MQQLLLITLLLALCTSFTCAVQIVRVVPSPEGNNAMMVRHDAFIDYKVRQNPINMLNHQDWRLRLVGAETSTMTEAAAETASKTDAAVETSFCGEPATATTPTTLSSAPSSSTSSVLSTTDDNTSVSTNTPPTIAALTPSALHTVSGGRGPFALYKPSAALQQKAAALTGPQNWDEQTHLACMDRLGALRGQASNPSGKAGCYNVQSLNNKTGTFSADLRLYQVSSAEGDWTTVQNTGASIGLAFSAASVQLQGIQNSKMARSPVPIESHTRLLRRANLPQLLQTLAFAGQVKTSMLASLNDE